MRHGRQICEGQDYQTGNWCVSNAHWRVILVPFRFWKTLDGHKVKAPTLTIYLCTTCHAMAELDWGNKAVPRKTEFSEVGYEMAAGHEAPLRRHAALFADACKRLPARQLALFGRRDELSGGLEPGERF